MQIKIIKLLFIGIAIIQNLNCQTNISLEDQNEIYSTVVDDIAKPLPPPPPPPATDDDLKPMPKSVIDSIKKIKLNLAIAPYMRISKERINMQNIDSSYHEIIEQLFVEDRIYDIAMKTIHSNIGHKVTVLDEAKINDKKQLFEDYDQLIYLSNIEFNQDRDRVVVYVGRTLPGKLSGMSVLYLLKKEKGNWVIDMVKELSVS